MRWLERERSSIENSQKRAAATLASSRLAEGPSGSFVLEEFRVDTARAVILEFGHHGGGHAGLDFFHHAFAELLVAHDRAGANLDTLADLAVVGVAFDDAGADGERDGTRGLVRRGVR